MNKDILSKPLAYNAKVQKLEALFDDVYRVILKLDNIAKFLPGQYLEIQVTKDHWQAFSLASLPGSAEVELHIQHLPGRENSVKLFNQLNSGDNLKVCIASGECVLRGKDRPLTLVAAGTGFAQIKTLVEALDQQNWQSPISFYWAAKNLAGLYDLDLAKSWQTKLANFTLIPVLEKAPKNWEGRVGRITDVLADDFPESNSAVAIEGFICGSPNMVYAVEDLLMSRGMPPRKLLSDAHAYAPRSY